MSKTPSLHIIPLFFVLCFMLSALVACNEDSHANAPVIIDRDSLATLRSTGVSTLISDSGIIRYKIIAEEWFIYDRRQPPFWAFEKGLFIERFDESFHVDAFITADTAYYYNEMALWELRGRVVVKNLRQETFRTSLLYWNLDEHRIYSPAYMEINGREQQLSGYDFSSDEQMTEYIIHSSKGAFPISDDTQSARPTPDAPPESAVPTDTAASSHHWQ